MRILKAILSSAALFGAAQAMAATLGTDPPKGLFENENDPAEQLSKPAEDPTGSTAYESLFSGPVLSTQPLKTQLPPSQWSPPQQQTFPALGRQ